MFLIFNKDKIMSYIVTVFTVVVLFLTATVFTNGTQQEVVETAAYGSKLLPIYSVETDEPKIAITINCAWNADDIDMILETLKKLIQIKVLVS